MEVLFALFVAAFMVREAARAVPDAIALAKGNPAPSVEKWKREHPDKPPEPGVRGYFGRMLTNSVERWADRSNRKHRRRKMLQATRQEHDDSEWVRKKIARTENRAKRAERWAAKRGVIWDKTKAAATARRDEKAAWEANAARDAHAADGGTEPATDSSPPPPRPGPPPAPEPPRPRPSAAREAPQGTRSRPSTADTPRERPDPGPSPRGGAPHYGRTGRTAGSESEGRTEYDDPHRGVGGGRFGDGRFFAPEDMDAMRRPRPAPEQQNPAPIWAEGEIVRETPKPAPPPLQLEAGPNTGTTEILDAEVVEDTPAPAEDTAGNPTPPTMEDANMTASSEITSLPAAKAYTTTMTAYLNSIKGIVEGQKAQLAKLAKDVLAEMADAELAMSSLQKRFTGGPVPQFQLANEQLAVMQQALSAADRALNPLQDSATSAVGAYTRASEAFSQQDGIAENVQVQAATGNVAADTAFYNA